MKHQLGSFGAVREGRENTSSLSHRDGGPRTESNEVSFMTLPSSRIAPNRATAGDPRFSALTLVLVLKSAMAEDLADCDRRGISRDNIADAMTRITGERISRTCIDKWVASTKTDRVIPTLRFGAWAEATGSRRVLELLCRQVGMVPIPVADQHIVDLIHKARVVFSVPLVAVA